MTTHPLMKTPLMETFERVRAIAEYLQKLKFAPEGYEWLSLRTLLSAESESLREMMARIGARYKSPNRRLPASFFFGDNAYMLLALASAAYLVDKRVPRLSPDSVWMHFNADGDVEGIALNDYHFAALGNDPAADHTDCLVLPSEDALQEYLLEQASACLQPLTQAVRADSTLGIPAMWALAADYASSAATYVARLMKQDALGVELARQLAAKQSPLRRKRDFIHIEECGLSFDLVDRVSCCLYYQAEDGRYCSSCPHRPQEERIEIIKKWLADSAAKEQAATEQTSKEQDSTEQTVTEEIAS